MAATAGVQCTPAQLLPLGMPMELELLEQRRHAARLFQVSARALLEVLTLRAADALQQRNRADPWRPRQCRRLEKRSRPTEVSGIRGCPCFKARAARLQIARVSANRIVPSHFPKSTTR